MIKDLINKKSEAIFDELLNDAISQKREVTLESAGDSMAPLLKEGDTISFKRVDINRLKRPDIIVFRERDTTISHRFVKTIRKNSCVYIISKSDIPRRYDSPIAEEDFLGLITKIEKPHSTIYLNTFKGRLKSYINIFIAPFYMLKQKGECLENEKENEFLLSAARIDNTDKDSISETRELFSRDLNWDYIFQKVKQNLIAPFFLRDIINSEFKNQIPPEIKKKVMQISHWQIYYDTKVYSQLKRVLSVFNRSNIKILLIKGAHLGEEIYGNTFLRWMGDVDILAKIDDWPKISDILRRSGFSLEETDYDYWGLKYLDNHITFFKDGVKLEVKFNMWFVDFPYFKDDIWKNMREILINGEKTYVPSLEDTLLIACVSLAKHNYARLIWFYDVREIINRFGNRIDWNVVIKRAREKDIDCMVYYALYYSSRLLNYEVPEDMLEKIKPSFIKRRLHNFFWDERIILWKKEGHPARAKIAFEIIVLLFSGKMSFRPRRLLKTLLYIGSVIMSDRAHLSRRYRVDRDSPKLILYYLLQPFRLALIALGSFMAIILRKK